MSKKFSKNNVAVGYLSKQADEFAGDLYDDLADYTPSGKGSTSTYVACYHSHPVLKFGTGTLIGGNCSSPVTDKADVYVALDGYGRYSKLQPWEGQNTQLDTEYKITDYCAPSDAPSFKKMIKWVCNQLQAGKTVHVGCIGGHGRTGTVISAILATLWDSAEWADAMAVLPDQGKLNKREFIQWVRKHYCKKAVESDEQVKFLQKHFKAAAASAAKPRETYTGKGYSGSGYSGGGYNYGGAKDNYDKSKNFTSSVQHVAGNRLIWAKIEKKA